MIKTTYLVMKMRLIEELKNLFKVLNNFQIKKD